MSTFITLNDISKKQRMLFLADSMSSLFNPIAYATSANLSFSADDVDVSNKMDGGWATSMQGKKSAEVSVDALCTYKTGLTSETELQSGWSSDKLYAFLYIMCSVEEQSDGSTKLKYDTSRPYYRGYMKLGSLELTSDNGDIAKFSVNGKSQGDIEQVPADGLMFSVRAIDYETVDVQAYNPDSVYVGNEFLVIEDLEDLGIIISSVHNGQTFVWRVEDDFYTLPESGISEAGDILTVDYRPGERIQLFKHVLN